MYFFLKQTERLKLILAESDEKWELQIQIVIHTVHVSVHVCRCMYVLCTIFWTLKENPFITSGSNHVVAYGSTQKQTRGSEKYFKEMKWLKQ